MKNYIILDKPATSNFVMVVPRRVNGKNATSKYCGLRKFYLVKSIIGKCKAEIVSSSVEFWGNPTKKAMKFLHENSKFQTIEDYNAYLYLEKYNLESYL